MSMTDRVDRPSGLLEVDFRESEISTENTTENVHPPKRYSSVLGRAPYVREIWVGEM